MQCCRCDGPNKNFLPLTTSDPTIILYEPVCTYRMSAAYRVAGLLEVAREAGGIKALDQIHPLTVQRLISRLSLTELQKFSHPG